MKLPREFCLRMQQLLGPEYPEFISSYHESRYFGLRINTSKIAVKDFLNIAPFSLNPIPWTDNGFYFSEEERPAKHPYYHAGLYYIQEPSAMIPAQVLKVRPGDKVLDLCAAPGGKSTQVGINLKGQGVLVANDISAERTKALTRNLELFGISNAVVTNEPPEKLAQRFGGFFSKILVDAPCSGEGMFRKDPDASRQWGVHTSAKCTVMQRDILFHAAKMLSPGGQIVYSTCTFAPEENEKMVQEFLAAHREFFLKDISKNSGLDSGRPEWANDDEEMKKTLRLWPHKQKGEGHFVALLEKRSTFDAAKGVPNFWPSHGGLESFFLFADKNLNIRLEGDFEFFGDHLYLRPPGVPDLGGIKVLRPGLYLGMVKKNRFEPAHSLALAFPREMFRQILDLPAKSRDVIAYLKGETLNRIGPEGWTVVCVDGFPLGWGKQLGGILKNHYPKGWRRLG